MITGASENKAVYIEHLTVVDSPVPQIQTLNNLKRKDGWPETECLAPDGGIIKISTLVFFFCSFKASHSKQLSPIYPGREKRDPTSPVKKQFTEVRIVRETLDPRDSSWST